MLRAAGLPPFLMVDCSHANSGKDAERQPAVAAELATQIAAGENAICGVMLESHLLGGTQDPHARPLIYGQSITDPCLSFEKTIPALAKLAKAVRARRARK
jgi:3-deoxy-7-phosphoheptulonate synthase